MVAVDARKYIGRMARTDDGWIGRIMAIDSPAEGDPLLRVYGPRGEDDCRWLGLDEVVILPKR